MNIRPLQQVFKAILSLNKGMYEQVKVDFWLRMVIFWKIFTIINN